MLHRSNPGAGLALWLRVMLPIIMGAPIQPPSQAQDSSTPSATAPSTSVPDVQLSPPNAEVALSFLAELLTGDMHDKKSKSGGVSGKLLESARSGLQCQVCS